MKKTEKFWHGRIKTIKTPIIGSISWCQDFPIFDSFRNFSGLETIEIRLSGLLVPAVELVEAHEMSKSLNLPKYNIHIAQ